MRGVTKDQLRQSMIDLINHLVMLDMYTVDPERILLLTPIVYKKVHVFIRLHMMYTIVSSVGDAKLVIYCKWLKTMDVNL